MDRVWYVILAGKEKGPYSFQDLLKIKELTPDTLARREGLKKWTPIRDIPELKKLFEDEASHTPPLKEVFGGKPGAATNNMVLSYPHAQPPLFYWLLLAAILFIYALLRLYYL